MTPCLDLLPSTSPILPIPKIPEKNASQLRIKEPLELCAGQLSMVALKFLKYSLLASPRENATHKTRMGGVWFWLRVRNSKKWQGTSGVAFVLKKKVSMLKTTSVWENCNIQKAIHL